MPQNILFPGENIKQKLVNELRNMFFEAEFRKEFLVMGIYALIFVANLFISGYIKNLLRAENGVIVITSLLFLGLWFVVSDFIKRKKLLDNNFGFILDSFLFTGFMIVIIVLTGGHDSPFKFTLLFLTVVSAPLYANFKQTFSYLLIIVLFNILISFKTEGLGNHIYFDIVESLAYFTIGIMINISVRSSIQKAKELKKINIENTELNKILNSKNQELEDTVNEKTSKLKQALEISEESVRQTQRQRLAIMNILEDVSETQADLEKSKQELEEKSQALELALRDEKSSKEELEKQGTAIMNILEDQSETSKILKKAKADLEKNQRKLEDLITISRDLAKTNEIYPAFKIVGDYLLDTVDCHLVGLFLYENVQADKMPFLTVCRVASSAAMRQAMTASLKDYLKRKRIVHEPNKVIFECSCLNQGVYPGKHNKANEIFIPLKISGKALGVVYIYFKDKTNAYVANKDILEANLNALSVTLLGILSTLKSEHSKTESLVKSLKNGMIYVDNNESLVLANPAVYQLLNIVKEKVSFEEIIEIFHDIDLRSKTNICLKKGIATFFDNVKVGTKHFELYINSVMDNDNKIMGASIILHDITQLKLIDQMKTEFVSVASHQLRTPLTAIKLFTEILYNEQVGKLSVQQKEYLDNVYQSTDRMVRLVNDLLNVTRMESGRLSITPEPTDLDNLVQVVVSEAAPIATSQGCKINFKNSSKLPKIMLDKNLVRQVLHNLVMNAVRYSSEQKGKIGIEIRKSGKDYVQVSVSDNGIGIPKKMQERIFEKFYRADNAVKVATEGTGLGLYVSKMIVENSGGKIWFVSQEGKGTTFYFTLPLKGMQEQKGERGLAIS